jgi:phage pi2 protein 07
MDIKNKANTQFGASKNLNMSEEEKDEYGFAFDGGVYYPHKDRWQFDAKDQPFYGEAALDMYRNLKGQIQ